MTLETILRWRTSAAVALAHQARDARDPALLAILADAIEEAGCESERVLTALRSGERWPIHLILGLGWWEASQR